MEENQVIEPKPARIFTAGTLRYTQTGLAIVFFWLMWNDFSVMLIESVTSLTQVLYQDHGATYTQMAAFGSIAAFLTIWINPWFSTWSDRHRGKWGRRRPFLFFSAPLFALCLVALPYMPEIANYAIRFQPLALFVKHLGITGPVLFIGLGSFLCAVFNAMVMAIFSYLYWDVVPGSVMGRFQSLTKIVGIIVALVWNFFIYGMADRHMKGVFLGTSVFCLVVYMLSTWQIKEGEYPPPDPHKKGGAFAPIRAYFVECFSDPFYLWIFAAFALYNINGVSSPAQFAYIHYDLKLDLTAIGRMNGWASTITTIIGLTLGFSFGALTDRLKPVRMMAPIYALWGLTKLIGYFYVHDQWSYLTWAAANNVFAFAIGVVQAAVVIEVFPREKLGQFCSANAVSVSLVCNAAGLLVAKLFDSLKNNRLSFLWQAAFLFIGAMAFVKVHDNWRKRHGDAPVPHAG